MKTDQIDALRSREWDLAVIGGGINGAGVARDAALRDMDTVLLEKDDFAQGTSSASTKLAHGGLRYLEQFEFGLVFEALQERKTLMEIAPHLVHPLAFFFPVYETSSVPAWKLRLGLIFYDVLSLHRGIGRHRFLDMDEVRDKFPELSHDGLKAVAQYYDGQMDDARIVHENVIDAHHHGAMVANYTKVTTVKEVTNRDLWEIDVYDRQQETSFSFRAGSIVNATGPWSDLFARNWRDNGRERLRPTKGVHLVLPPLDTDVAGFFPSIHDDDRLFFAIPWEGRTLLGTTDTDFQGDPDDLSVNPADREYLLTNINHYLSGRSYGEQDILAEFAGLRPLYSPSTEGDASESEVSRDHEIIVERGSVYTIVGGKYTTYRAMAEETLDVMQAPGPCVTGQRPLPGGWKSDDQRTEMREQLLSEYPLSEEQVEELLFRYGRQCLEVLEVSESFGDSLEPVGDRPVPIRAQVYYGVLKEWARTPEDIIRRRTDLFMHEDSHEETVRELMMRIIENQDHSMPSDVPAE